MPDSPEEKVDLLDLSQEAEIISKQITSALLPNYGTTAADLLVGEDGRPLVCSGHSIAGIAAIMSSLATRAVESQPYQMMPLQGFSHPNWAEQQEQNAEREADKVAQERDDYVNLTLPRDYVDILSQISALRRERDVFRQEYMGQLQEAPTSFIPAHSLTDFTNALGAAVRLDPDYRIISVGWDPAITKKQVEDPPIISWILAARANPPPIRRRSVWERLLEDT